MLKPDRLTHAPGEPNFRAVCLHHKKSGYWKEVKNVQHSLLTFIDRMPQELNQPIISDHPGRGTGIPTDNKRTCRWKGP